MTFEKQSFPKPASQDLKSGVHGVGIILTPDSAEMKQEPLGKAIDAVKVFDERLKTMGDDVQTMEYSNKNCSHLSVAYEGHRTYPFKQSESIIKGTERGGIDVEWKEVTQMSDRISPINIQNSKFSKLPYDPGGTCFFDEQGKLLGYASSPMQIQKEGDCIKQSTTNIRNAVSSVVKLACLDVKVEREEMVLLKNTMIQVQSLFLFSIPRSSQNTKNSHIPPNSNENECAWNVSLSSSGNVGPNSSIDNIGVVTAMSIVNRYASTCKNDDGNSVHKKSKFVTRMDITKLKIMASSTGVLTISVPIRVDQSREDNSMKLEQENIVFMKQFEGQWRMKPVFVNEEACYPFKPTTLHQVLDPMLLYFDSGQHWISQWGLTMKVLPHMSYWEAARNQQLILVNVVCHLKHKNVTPMLENKWWFSGNIKLTSPMLQLHKE
ncbi:hypothetical protein V6N13_053471 [Hibiscus sabdariffa]|uniref:DUF220 domain-containing protein n=1 Tax=Hibiscus sabdariffa TaxID=183260 RepID=A0ABR2T7E9_9ROSI